MRIFHFVATLTLLAGLNAPAIAQRKAAPTAAKKATPAPAKKAATAAARKVAPKPRPAAWVNVIARTPEGGYRQGNPNAAVKLIEYGSRTCPACARFAADAMPPLRDNYIATGKVSYEFRDLLVHGAPDLAAALLNQCVPDQAFFGMLDQLFANQPQFLDRLQAMERASPQRVEALQQLPPAQAAAGFADAVGYVGFMKQRDISEADARACLADPARLNAIANANASAAGHDIHGTPSFLINGSVVAPHAWGGIEPLLKAAIR